MPKFSAEAIEEFLFDFMLCVRTSVLNGTKIADSLKAEDLAPPSFAETQSYELNRGGTDHKIYVIDYASAVFHFMREMCGVSSSAFLLAWSANDIKGAQVEGSSLLYSCDKKFVAMALLDRDLDVLLEILPRYYEHMRTNPNTFLLKMFGVLRIMRGKKMVPYLLMENVFHRHIPLHFMYHVTASAEGVKTGVLSRMSSTLRRRSSSASKMTLSRSRGSLTQLMGGKVRTSTLTLDPPAFSKDKMGHSRTTTFGNEASWRAEGRTILVDKTLRPALVQQLVSDLGLLRDCGITDHKLLIGIHEGEPIAPPSPDFESKRLVKVPSMVVFQSHATVKSSGEDSSSLSSSASDRPSALQHVGTPLAGSNFDLSNLRRAKRVSVQSVDAEQPVVSPFRQVKGGMHSRIGNREELYYIGIIDIFSVQQKDKRRQEKASSRFAAFKEWLVESFEEYLDPDTVDAAPVAEPGAAKNGSASLVPQPVKKDDSDSGESDE